MVKRAAELPVIDAPDVSPAVVSHMSAPAIAATPDLQPVADRLQRLLTAVLTAQVDLDAIAGRGGDLKARLDALDDILDRSSLESACLVGLDAKALAADVCASVLEE